MNIIEKIEEEILSDESIFLDKIKKDMIKDLSLKEFLVKFFTQWNNEYNTLNIISESIQTLRGRRRSIGDIFRICKYYYPNCKLKEVLYIMYKELISEINLYTWYCSNIRKRVWFINPSNNPLGDPFHTDEFGYLIQNYVDDLNQ